MYLLLFHNKKKVKSIYYFFIVKFPEYQNLNIQTVIAGKKLDF